MEPEQSEIATTDMPKLRSPFIREKINDKYVCTPQITPGYEWVFTSNSTAVEKLDGTNVSTWVKDKTVDAIMNRKNHIEVWKKGQANFAIGVLQSIYKGHFKPHNLADGGYFGELIGEKIQGNPYNIHSHLWMPFSYTRTRYMFKFWFDFVKELEGKSPEEIYNKTSDLFKGLWSLFKRKNGVTGDVTKESTFLNSAAAEGLVIYPKDIPLDAQSYGRCAKLRRDMFDWYNGDAHQTYRE